MDSMYSINTKDYTYGMTVVYFGLPETASPALSNFLKKLFAVKDKGVRIMGPELINDRLKTSFDRLKSFVTKVHDALKSTNPSDLIDELLGTKFYKGDKPFFLMDRNVVMDPSDYMSLKKMITDLGQKDEEDAENIIMLAMLLIELRAQLDMPTVVAEVMKYTDVAAAPPSTKEPPPSSSSPSVYARFRYILAVVMIAWIVYMAMHVSF